MPYDPILDPLLEALMAYVRQQATTPDKGLRLLLKRMDALEAALRQMVPPPEPEEAGDSILTEMIPKRRGFSVKTIGSNY